MGEARRRREHDPNFGRIPKSPPIRGLVVSPPMEIEGTHLRIKSSRLDPQELRFALLFWDRLLWPSSRAIYIESGPDEAFLESARILTRPDYTVNGDAAQGMAIGQVQAFLDREQSEPGVWSLAQGTNSFLWKDGFAQADSGVAVELHRAIPIPDKDVPLAEILEFKSRRKDELLLFRRQMESFIADIELSEDKEAALQNALSEIDDACANLLKVGKEWQFPVHLSDIRASCSISLKEVCSWASAGWILGEPYGLTAATAAAAVAGLASTLDVKADPGLRSPRRPASPYRYAGLIHRELR